MLLFARISIGYSQLSSKNGLDKPAKIAYNKSKESTPVDGLLPLLELRFNRRELVASGRLFPFVVVVMENIVHQCYNSNDQDTVLNQI